MSRLFGKIAPRYDFINDLQSFGLHRLWKRRSVALAEPGPGKMALDVCSGTGDLALALAREGAFVTAFDASSEMLAIARSRFAREKLAINIIEGDAENLPFENAEFEITTIGYGLRNLPSWQRGLEELVRVTKSGGSIIILDFGKPPNKFWRKIFFTYLRTAVPVFGRIFAGDWKAYSYILESLEAYPEALEISSTLKKLGCGSVQLHPILGGAMTIHHAKC